MLLRGIISLWSPIGDMAAVLSFVESAIAKFSTVVNGSDLLGFVLNVVLFMETISLLIAIVWPWFQEYFGYLMEHPVKVNVHFGAKDLKPEGASPVTYDTPVTVDASENAPASSPGGELVPVAGGQTDMIPSSNPPYITYKGKRYAQVSGNVYQDDEAVTPQAPADDRPQIIDTEGHTVSE